jgi:hypothetical protein
MVPRFEGWEFITCQPAQFDHPNIPWMNMRKTKNVQIGPEDTYQEKLGDRDEFYAELGDRMR